MTATTNTPIDYSASIEFDRKKVTRLARMQSYSGTILRTITGIICAAALIIIGVLLRRGFIAMLCLAIGAFTFIGLYSRESNLVTAIIDRYKGEYPMVFYYISAQGIKSSKLKDMTGFDTVTMLMDDKSFFYIFHGKDSLIMAEKDTIKGDNNYDGFQAYMTGKTGLKWKKPGYLLMANLKQICHDWRTKAEKDNFSGERLG